MVIWPAGIASGMIARRNVNFGSIISIRRMSRRLLSLYREKASGRSRSWFGLGWSRTRGHMRSGLRERPVVKQIVDLTFFDAYSALRAVTSTDFGKVFQDEGCRTGLFCLGSWSYAAAARPSDSSTVRHFSTSMTTI
jgi:hypothetical protein